MESTTRVTHKKRPSGLFGFSIVWLGQIVSVLASSMTGFGMTLWIYKQTESATAMAGMRNPSATVNTPPPALRRSLM